VACICHFILFFSATTHYFLQKIKYCVVASLSQHITFCFWVTTHYFFQKNIVVRHVRNTIFFEKIMCCGKFVTTHYFWDTTRYFFKKYCVVASLSQHIIFWVTTHYFFKKYCVMRHVRNTIFFWKKIMCCGKFVTTHYFLSHDTRVNVSSNDPTTGCYLAGTGSLLSWCTVGIHGFNDPPTSPSVSARSCKSLQVRGGEAACQPQQPAALASLHPLLISAVSRQTKGEAVRVTAR